MFSYQLNISEHSHTEESCLVFMTPEYNLYALSQISNVHVKYLAFSIEKNIKINTYPCSSGGYLQNVTMTLICKGNAGIYKLIHMKSFDSYYCNR